MTFYDPPTIPTNTPHGTLIRIERLAPNVHLPPDSIGYRMLYASHSIDNSTVMVSGFAVIPRKKPPSGGWPVINWAHPTDGLAPICAPSRYQYLEVPYLNWFTQHGYAVVATDYQSLGTPGVDPYLVGTAEGMDMLDAALAATEIPGYRISYNDILFGYSQGGQAALFASQIAKKYTPNLHVMGVAVEAPAVGLVRTLTSLRRFSTLNGLYVTLAFAWSHTYKNLPLSSLLSARARSKMLLGSLFTECQNGISNTYKSIPAKSLTPPGLLSNSTFLALLHENDPGNSSTDMPMFVAYGRKDIIIPNSAYQSFIHKACHSDPAGVYTFISPSAGHGTILQAAQSSVEKWIQNISAKRSIPSNCAKSINY